VCFSSFLLYFFIFHLYPVNPFLYQPSQIQTNPFFLQNPKLTLQQAPFPGPPGPGILPFFEGLGPYKRWLIPTETPAIQTSITAMKNGTASPNMAPEIESLIRTTVTEITSSGGKVVGAIGFSQGTRVVAGLLAATQIKRKLGITDKEMEWLNFDFGISVCGAAPPPLMPPCATAALAASGLSEEETKEMMEARIQIPSLHVLGTQDEYEWAGRMLIEKVYEEGEGMSEVIESDTGHNYPVAPEDTEKMKDWILETYKNSVENSKR
jgi:hypothetical protein